MVLDKITTNISPAICTCPQYLLPIFSRCHDYAAQFRNIPTKICICPQYLLPIFQWVT
jgi:hypothetical protein